MIEDTQIDKLITEFLSGTISAQDCKALEEWIEETPENKQYFGEIRNIWHIAHPAFNPDSIETQEVKKKFIQQISIPQPNIRHVALWVYWQRIAAVLLIPLALITGYMFTRTPAISYVEESFQELTVPFGMVSQVDLPDGSKVWLNGGSSIKFPVNFRKGQRAISLTGEGYFEVEADKNNPFTVETPHSKIIATGTSFNINAHEKDTITAITLIKGVVDVELGQAPSIQMQPGDHLNYNNKKANYSIRQTDPYKWYAWKDGQMIFRDDSLMYVFKRLEQTFNVEFLVKDPGITDALYRASFEEESLNEILRLLELTTPIQFVYLNREKDVNNRFKKQQIEVMHKK